MPLIRKYTRASTATYVDQNGVVQTAAIDQVRTQHYVNGVLQPPLVEAAATNRSLQSENLLASWSTNAAASLITANAAIAPNGTLTADEISDNPANANSPWILQQKVVPAGPLTFSVWLKKLAGSAVYIAIWDNSSGFQELNVTALLSDTQWTRVSITRTPNPASTLQGWGIGQSTSADRHLLFWGAQAENGSAATSYIPTTAVEVTRAADIDNGLAAVANGYTRTVGDFVADGVQPGMVLSSAAFTQDQISSVYSVSALSIVTITARAVEAVPAANAIISAEFPVAIPAGANFIQRNSPATYFDVNGVVRTAPANALRDNHYVNGALQPALIEKTATNLILFSEQFGNAAWAKVLLGAGSVPVVTDNQGIAPNGNNAAALVVFAAPGVGDGSRLIQTPTVIANQIYAMSVWIKAATNADVGKTLIFRGVAGGAYKSVLLTTAWQRISSVEVAFSTSGNFELGLRPGQGGSSSGTVSVMLWGAQQELGAISSSYIQATAAAATRAEDYFAAAGSFTGGWLLAERGHVAPPAPPKPKVRKPSQAELHAARVAREFAARQAELKAVEDRRIENARKLWGASETTQPTYMRIPKAVKTSQGPKILRLPRSK